MRQKPAWRYFPDRFFLAQIIAQLSLAHPFQYTIYRGSKNLINTMYVVHPARGSIAQLLHCHVISIRYLLKDRQKNAFFNHYASAE